MSIFEICPVCGELAPVHPEYSTAFSRFFKCHGGHVFKKNVRAGSIEMPWEEINGLERCVLVGSCL